jgi:hypothetical protein
MTASVTDIGELGRHAGNRVRQGSADERPARLARR